MNESISRTFILRCRNAAADARQFRSQVGGDSHPEIIAHTVMSAFFVSQSVRLDTELYIIFDKTSDYPKSLRLCMAAGLSISAAHEGAIFDVIEQGLKAAGSLQKGQRVTVRPGLELCGFGFERVLDAVLPGKTGYMLEPEGVPIRATALKSPAVFILSDHRALSKNSLKGLERMGLEKLSLGPQMLFAYQAVTLVHYELDN